MAERDLQKEFRQHKHSGIDGVKVNFNDLSIIKGDAITEPSGGGTVDAEARTAINTIISRLEDFGLINEN